MPEQPFDAIVIGSGITGGWAARELTGAGLKTLLLERGREVRHARDYITEGKPDFQRPWRGNWPPDVNPDEYFTGPDNYHYFNNEKLNPYIRDEGTDFRWVRANVLGGRSLVWGRQCYRWSEMDFEANKKDGHGIDWPIRYRDIAPWYSHVEKVVGVSGEKLGLKQLPDGEFLPPMDLSIAEKHFKKAVAEHFDGRVVTIGRGANLTEARPEQGRAACQYRAQCHRGCSFGAYWSTQSTTLPAARATGNLTIKTDTVVDSLEYDAASGRVAGVRAIDVRTGARTTYRSRIVFLNASAVASTQILMNSRSEAMPNGLGNNHDVLGRYLMDHTWGSGATGTLPGYTEYVEYGRRPTGMYIPRFRNVDGQEEVPFVRGYNFQSWGGGRSQPEDWSGFGADLKNRLRVPGPWKLPLWAFCEMLPHRDNRMTIDDRRPDRFGIPQVRFDVSFRENEHAMLRDAFEQAVAMLKAAGCVEIDERPLARGPGWGIHEMGTARMGHDPRESVLNGWNQVHDAPNVFVTDGAAMTSSSCVNPSITYAAFTARAANHAVELVRSGVL